MDIDKKLCKEAEGKIVSYFDRINYDVLNDYPEKGYFTAMIPGHDDIAGVARSRKKAIGFVLQKLARKIINEN